MSKSPSQQCGPPTSDGRYLGFMPHSTSDREQGTGTASNQTYLTPKPPRFLFPDNQGYDPTAGPKASGSLFVFQGRPQGSGPDKRYSIPSGGAPSLSHHGLQRTSPLVGSTEYQGPSSSYNDATNSALSYGRGSIASGARINDVDSQYSSSSTAFPSPVRSETSTAPYRSNMVTTAQQHQTHRQLQPPQPQKQRSSGSSIPTGFDKILHPVPAPPRRPSTTSRYHLHVRQQPIAARACGAGDRDRRPVDPPPIVQMLLTDFDPTSQSDKALLQDPRFTVGCLLIPATASSLPVPSERDGQSPRWEDRAALGRDETASGRLTPLLSGKSFVSPFYVDADPDPDTSPTHPASDYAADTGIQPSNPTESKHPGTFYIFSDLSVRTAGLYQFQFRLMNWGSVEDTGQSMPILAEVWSEPFRVYPAKDFPGMRDSSPLAEGLKELGFVELKTRGKGKGKGRRR